MEESQLLIVPRAMILDLCSVTGSRDIRPDPG
jgi:hypothetical protein